MLNKLNRMSFVLNFDRHSYLDQLAKYAVHVLTGKKERKKEKRRRRRRSKAKDTLMQSIDTHEATALLSQHSDVLLVVKPLIALVEPLTCLG